jgi:hypothetical protein
MGPGGNDVAVNLSVSDNTIIIDPVDLLDSFAAYSVMAEPGIKAVNGTQLSETVSWMFTTDAGDLPPELELWESNMLTYGRKWGEYQNPVNGNSFNSRVDNAYYDGQWVFYQIADYTKDKSWYDYAEHAEITFRDDYYRISAYSSSYYTSPGYYRFPHGIFEDYMRSDSPSGTRSTMDDVRAIRDNPAYSRPEIEDSFTQNERHHAHFARETAYAIHSNITAEKAGEPRKEERVRLLLSMTKNHLDQWQSNDYSSPSWGTSDDDYFQPFMFGLAAHAIIDFYEWELANGRDPDVYFPDIPGRLASFATWLFNDARLVSGPGAGERLWVSDIARDGGSWSDAGGTGDGAFRYADRYTPREFAWEMEPKPSPDLNLLIAPAYAWLYMKTGNMDFRNQADLIFASGVRRAAVDWSGKIFDQNYRWSFAYIKYREQGNSVWLN